MRKAFAAFLAVGLVGLASAAWAEPLKVFVTVPPQKYVVQAVGGPRVEVSVLVPPDTDPHIYRPRPRQMVELSRAAIYFAIGCPFEAAHRKGAGLGGSRRAGTAPVLQDDGSFA